MCGQGGAANWSVLTPSLGGWSEHGHESGVPAFSPWRLGRCSELEKPVAGLVAQELGEVLGVVAALRLERTDHQHGEAAGCMASQGYNYVPTPPPTTEVNVATLPHGYETAVPGDFGARKTLTYSMAKQTAAGAGIVASNAAGYYQALRGVVITNTSTKYLATLDFRAYDGVAIQSAPYGYTAAETGGCEAEGRIYVSEPALNALASLRSLAAPLAQELATDPEIAEANQDWSDCMIASDAGAYDTVDDVSAKFFEDASTMALNGATTAQWNAFESQEELIASKSMECIDESQVVDVIVQETGWDSFVATNYSLFMLAGGQTFAEGGAI